MTYNYTKTFFSKTRATAFADQIKKNGAEDVTVWNGTDAFGQINYTVKWNLWK